MRCAALERGILQNRLAISSHPVDQNAEVLATLGFCPQCSQQDEAAVSSLKAAAYGKAVLFGALVAGVLFFVCSNRYGITGFEVLIAVGGGLFTAIATVVKDSWKWTEVADRVEVLRVDEVMALMKEFS